MIQTGLDFAPGTADDCKKIVGRIPPEALLGAYRTACQENGTRDVVLVLSDQKPDILGGTRSEYAQHLRRAFGSRAAEFKMYSESAHSIMQLPSDTDAMWLVVNISQSDLPLMCVVYAMPYELSDAAAS